MNLTPNEGPLDRALRTAAGIVLVASGTLFPVIHEPIFLGTAAVGLVLLTTGLVGVCPLYKIVGLKTTPKARPAV
jgi:hypothetical protein